MDETLLRKIKDMEESGMEVTRSWVSMWQEAIRYFFSDQLRNVKRHKDWDWIVINYIWPAAMQEIAKLAKNNPTIYTNPWEPSDGDTAEMMQSALQYIWEKGINGNGMRLEQIRQILDKKIYGYSVSKIFWDDKLFWDDKQKAWIGDVKYRLWHPAEFWASNEEKIDEGSCGTVRYVTLEYAIKKWPDFKKELTAESEKNVDIVSSGGGNSIAGFTSTGITTWPEGTGKSDTERPTLLLGNILTNDRLSGNGIKNLGKNVKIVKISECYFHDNSEVPRKLKEDISAEELLSNGQLVNNNGIYTEPLTGMPIVPDQWPSRITKEWDEPNYPNGRYVIRCGDTGLNPSDQKYKYSRWPFIVMPHYLLPHMWQGINAVEMYKSVQDMINISISHLTNHMKQFGDPRIAIETGALDSPPGSKKSAYKIGSGAGAIIRLVRGGLNRMKIIDPPNTSPVIGSLYQLLSQEFKNLTGLQGIATGQPLKSDSSATEASLLMMSATDRVFLQNVYEEEWVRQCAGLIAEIVQDKYDVGRMVRIVGQDKVQSATEINQKIKDVKFDIAIMPGSMLPFDEEKKIAKYLKAYELLSQPIPNPMLPEMLRTLEIPNWQKMLQQSEMYQKFIQFTQLYEGVKTGKIPPQNAVAMLMQAMGQQWNKETKGGLIPVPQELGKEKISLNYKDAPDDIKRQIESAAGFQPSTMATPEMQLEVLKAKLQPKEEPKDKTNAGNK